MIRFKGHLYRALNPIFAREPLSGHGAQLHGGRFNPKGVAALYSSLSVVTALREANQAGSLQPTTLVSYRADIEAVFDGTDRAALAGEGIDDVSLADPRWRDAMVKRGEGPTQSFARRLIAAGYNGLLVRSFAAGAGVNERNLVIWRWGHSLPSKLALIDDEGRLTR